MRRLEPRSRFVAAGGIGVKRVERLMREAGLSGLHRRRRGRTTISVQGVRTAPDLVERDFKSHIAELMRDGILARVDP